MDVKVESRRRLRANELIFSNFVIGGLLRAPWAARRSNQSVLKEINPEYLLERLMLRLEAPILWPPDVKRHDLVTGQKRYSYLRDKSS